MDPTNPLYGVLEDDDYENVDNPCLQRDAENSTPIVAHAGSWFTLGFQPEQHPLMPDPVDRVYDYAALPNALIGQQEMPNVREESGYAQATAFQQRTGSFQGPGNDSTFHL